MKVSMVFISIIFIFLTSCTTESSTESYIKIVNISPEPETHITLVDTITATLDYSVSDENTSNFGYGINILFVAKPEYGGYVPYSWDGFKFQSRRGKLTIDFPLTEVTTDSHKINDPIVLTFKLEKWISDLGAEIIASTKEVVYK